MSVIVTRVIQIVCLLLSVICFFAILHSGFDSQVIGIAGSIIGFSVMIFLLASILRVVSDAAEKVLHSLGYRKEEKTTAASAPAR